MRARVVLACVTLITVAGLAIYATYKHTAGEASVEEVSAFDVFESWAVSRGVQASASDNAIGVLYAQRRSEELRRLANRDPAAALRTAQTFDCDTRAKLSTKVEANMEQWVNGEATIELLCPLSMGVTNETGQPLSFAIEHEYDYVVSFSASGVSYRALVYGRRLSRHEPRPVFVWGMLLEGSATNDKQPVESILVLHEDPVQPLSRAEVAALVPTRATGDSFAVRSGSGIHFFPDTRARDEFTRMTIEREDEIRGMHIRFINYQTNRALTVLVVIARFADETGFITTADSYDIIMQRANTYWQLNSYGAASIQFPVRYVNVALSGAKDQYSGTCPISSGKSSAMDDEAMSLAGAQGAAEGDYDRYIIIFSAISACSWAGLGSIASNGVWVNGLVDPNAHWHVPTHELGHNFGLKHANFWYGGGSSPVGDPGSSVPYGDPFDIMGAVGVDYNRANFHINVEKKNGLGWIPDSDIQAVTVPGLYRVYAHDAAAYTTGTRALTVTFSDTTKYWLEYRVTLDYPPARDYFANGVNVHWAYATNGGFELETNLLDLTAPYASASIYDTNLMNSALQLGTTFFDGTNTYLTPYGKGLDSTGPYFDVYIHIGAKVGGNPTITSLSISCGGPVSGLSPEINEAVLVSAAATSSSALLSYQWDFGDGSLSTVNAPNVIHQWTTTGFKIITVTVSNMQGGSASQTLTVNIGKAGTSTCPPCPGNCNERGVCSGGTCSCAFGWTGSDCDKALVIDQITPGYGPLSGGTIITVDGRGFSQGPVQCQFAGLKTVSGTYLSVTRVTCPSPPSTRNGTVILQVAPAGGYTFTTSSVSGFTYGGGTCVRNCSDHGVCQKNLGECRCDDGWTGRDCATAIGITGSLSPARGPYVGGSHVTVPVEGFGGVDASVVCRFGMLATFAGAYTASTSTVICVSPEGAQPSSVSTPYDLLVAVSVDGVSFTNSTTSLFTYEYAVELTAGLAYEGSTAGVAYHIYRVWDSHVPVNVTFGFVESHFVLLARPGEAPELTNTSLPHMLSFSETSTTPLVTGWLHIVVVQLQGVATAYTLTIDQPATSFPSDGAWRNLAGASSFSVLHSPTATGLATVVEVQGDADVKLNGNLADGSQPLTGTSSLIMQMCHFDGTYMINVNGVPGSSYTVRAYQLAPPTPGITATLTAVSRGQSSVVINWSPATDGSTYDYDLVYQGYYRATAPGSPFSTPCAVWNTAGAAGDAKSFGPFEKSLWNMAGLSPSTSYEFSMMVTNSAGVSSVYTPMAQRTLPPSLPPNLLYVIGGGCLAAALLGGLFIGITKIRGDRKLVREAALRKEAAERKGRRRTKASQRKVRPMPTTSHQTTPPVGSITPAAPAGTLTAVMPGAAVMGVATATAGDKTRDPRRRSNRPQPAESSEEPYGDSSGRRRKRRRDRRRGRDGDSGDYASAEGVSPTAALTAARLPAPPAIRSPPAKTMLDTSISETPVIPFVPGAVGNSPPGTVIGLAVSDFVPEFSNELGFKAGQKIVIVSNVGAGWLSGILDGRKGLVPAAFVKLLRVPFADGATGVSPIAPPNARLRG